MMERVEIYERLTEQSRQVIRPVGLEAYVFLPYCKMQHEALKKNKRQVASLMWDLALGTGTDDDNCTI